MCFPLWIEQRDGVARYRGKQEVEGETESISVQGGNMVVIGIEEMR